MPDVTRVESRTRKTNGVITSDVVVATSRHVAIQKGGCGSCEWGAEQLPGIDLSIAEKGNTHLFRMPNNKKG